MVLSPRQRRWAGIAVALTVLFTVFGFLIAPPILKAQLVKRLSAELGRDVKIDKIRLNPYVMSLTIEGLAIRERDGAPFFAWRRVYVNFDAASFFVREWRFQEIIADAPSSRVIVNADSSLNFSDLIAKFAPPPGKSAESKPAAGKPPWPLRIASLTVNDAGLDFADHSQSGAFASEIGPVSFVLKNFHTAPGDGAPYQFAATTESGEKLTWSGRVSVVPLGSQGEFTLAGIKLQKYAPYYRKQVRFDVLGGSLDVGGRYELDLSGAAPRVALAGGAVHLTGLKLAPRDGKVPVLELEDCRVEGLDANLGKLSVTVGKVSLTGGKIAAHRTAEGAIDLVSLLTPVVAVNDRPSMPGTPAPAAAPLPPAKPDVKIAELAVRKFAVSFEDHTTPRVALNTIENAEFDAKNLTLTEGAAIPMHAALAFSGQGAVKVDGTVTLLPVRADLTVEANDLGFASISPYVEPALNLRIAQGTLTAKGHVRLALVAGAPPDLGFQGDVSINHFLAVDGEAGQEFSSWSALTINGIDFASTPLALAVNEISWSDPAAHLIVNRDGSNNLASILRKDAAQPGNGPAPETAPVPISPAAAAPSASVLPAALPKITVGKIIVANGAFTLADRSVDPAVNTAINQFGGTIAGLASTNLARADVDLKATVDGAGPVSMAGKLDPLGAEKFVDLKLDFKNVDLTPFSPYSGKFAGFELARGKLFLDVTAKLQGDKVNMANVVTLTQFTFGPPTNSPEATKLPVRLGVALLKDTEGKMIIDIPVEGSLGDPAFRIGRVVWRVIGNLLTKAATSPFSLLGAMFGGGGDELAYQEFAAGSSELTPENVQKLTTLTKALGARPGLNLEIAGSFDPAADVFALKQQHLTKQLRTKLWEVRRVTDPNVPPPEQLMVSPEDEAELVRKIFAGKFPPGTELGSPLPVAPPVAKPVTPVKRGFLGRVVDVVTLKPLREEKAAEKKEAVGPATATSTGAVTANGPSLDEMKLRLADTLAITDDDLRQLATARAQKVRDHFLQAQIAPERLFLANVTLPGKGPRVTLQLQ